MSERRLKLGHRKEYKRKSKHTRNPSYYPRHLTKVTLADFDADFNLRISKEVAAQRGYGRKVLDKSCHIAWVRFPTAAHPEPCNSNPIRCLERNNQPNRLK